VKVSDRGLFPDVIPQFSRNNWRQYSDMACSNPTRDMEDFRVCYVKAQTWRWA